MDTTVTKLDHPIPFEGRTLSEITMRRAKVSDTLSARKGGRDNADQEIHLIASLAGLPPAAIEDLDMQDYAKLQAVISLFFGSSETTA